MKIKEVMTRTSLKFYENDLVKDVSHLFISKKIAGGLVYSHHDHLTGVITSLEILTALHIKKQHLKDVLFSSFKILNEDDEIRTIDFGSSPCHPVQDVKGKITGYLTKEQYLSAYAKESQIKLKHFDAIFNSAHNGILSIDASGKITSINPPATKMAKTTQEKAVGKFLTDVVLPAGLLEVVRTGKGHTEKYRAGKRMYITNRSPIIENDKVVGAVGVFQDISDIEFISNELETVKEIVNELNTIINTSTNGICIINETSEVIRMNEQFKKMFQLNEQTMKKKIALPEKMNDLVRQVLLTKKAHSILQKDLDTNNSLIISCTPIIDNEKNVKRVVINVKDMTEMEKLRDELATTKKMLSSLNQQQETGFIYHSKAMKRLINTLRQVAEVDVTVLLTGESGVGKGEVANLIRQFSPRKDEPFVRVNCGAIPESLIESELFGYERGAFTGASKKGKKGYFEQADGGTIFLDEIGELPQNLQVKLLTVLQDKEIVRIGAEKPKKIDVRIIAATNKDLETLVAKGDFREDLYYRLNVVPLLVPPLRERIEDIPVLVEYYNELFSEKYNRSLMFTEESIKAFLQYDWPGNVRELVNIIERAFITSLTSTVEYADIVKLLNLKDNTHVITNFLTVKKIVPLQAAVEETEKQLIAKALQEGKTYRQAAKLLDVNVSTVSRKIKKYEKEMGEL